MKIKQYRRQEAAQRQEARHTLTPNEQLARLDERQGEAERERARLQKLIDAGNGDVRGLEQYEVEDDA